MRKEQIITTNNNQMEEKGMKSRFIHIKKRFVAALSGALMGVMLMSTTCFAAGTGTSAVTQPLENLKTLIIAVIGAVGVIILAKNVMEFAQAYQQQDSSTMNSALTVSYTHLDVYKRQDMIKRDLDSCILQAGNYEQFLELLSDKGYEVKQGKYLAVKPQGMTKMCIRDRTSCKLI